MEAEAAKASWEALMKLPVKNRVRKRKAIDNVLLDESYSGVSSNNYHLIKVTYKTNLSDFKEGECMILHPEHTMQGIKCTLYEYVDDNTAILEVFPPDMPGDMKMYHDVSLILDRQVVDLRENVYLPFICSLPAEDEFWKNLVINSKEAPVFENEEYCEEKLNQTIESFGLRLLPKQREAVLRSMCAKDYYLIQGPPGTGKSFVLGIIMLEELADLNHNVIVIGPNHLAVNNALVQPVKLYPPVRNSFLFLKVGQDYNAPDESILPDGNIPNVAWNKVRGLQCHWCLGLTPHALYTSRARGLECDTLIIDEAGQMTVPLTIMGMIKAKKVIFAGDHKQLAPIVSSDKIRYGLRQSAFQTIISDDNCTMLDTSFRMCEPICDFVSELFYEGKLKSNKKGCGDKIRCYEPLYDFSEPVILHNIDDNGEQTSDKEAEFIADAIVEFLHKGLSGDEIGVLAPFRAQAANIRRYIRKHEDIPEEQQKLIVSDTIDKMQGQEREVIFLSMVSGDTEYMTEMAEFLYNPNKLNVAFSRAKSKLIIVGNLKKIKDLNLPEYLHLKAMFQAKAVTIV